ncbi:unnamed protein product [Penicillium glandicola]
MIVARRNVAVIDHGTYFYRTAVEGVVKNDTNINAGICVTLSSPSDHENDEYCEFEIVEGHEDDTISMLYNTA